MAAKSARDLAGWHGGGKWGDFGGWDGMGVMAMPPSAPVREPVCPLRRLDGTEGKKRRRKDKFSNERPQ